MGLYFLLRRLRMLTPIGTRQLMPQTSAERGGVSGAWLRQKYKPTLRRYLLNALSRRRRKVNHVSFACAIPHVIIKFVA